jgi:hypothetical protein
MPFHGDEVLATFKGTISGIGAFVISEAQKL